MAKVTKTKIGRVMLLNKGTYNSETAYSELDVVKESGRTYICLKNCKGIQPTNTEYWILAADIGISPTNKEDYNTEEEKSLYANELSDYGKIALDEYTAEKVEQLIAKEVELEGVLDTEKDKQIGIINDKTENYNTNAETKTSAFNTNASDKAAAFDTNAETKTSAFNTNASDKTAAFNTNVNEKTSAFNTNSESKTSDFNTNATEKTANFNQNASDKVAEFDDVKDDLLGQADDLFDALTTNEASGTEIYIDDAKACRVINSEIDGMYQQETTKGIQIAKIYKSSTITTIYNNMLFKSDNIPLEPATTYTLSFRGKPGDKFKTNSGEYGCCTKTTNITVDSSGIGIVTFTTKDEFTSSQTGILANMSENNTLPITNICVAKGTYSNLEFEPYTGGNPSPNPDYQQAIEQVDSLKLISKNKNLLDLNKFNATPNKLTIVEKNNEFLKLSGVNGYYIGVWQKMILKPTTKYSIRANAINTFNNARCSVWIFDNTYPEDCSLPISGRIAQKYLDMNISGEVSFTFTTDSTGIIYVVLQCNNIGNKGIITYNKVQLEEGDKVTNYIPYTLQNINIDLQGNKLCAVSDTIKDKLLIDRNGNVALQKNIGNIIFKGNEMWSLAEKGFYNSSYFVKKKNKNIFEACCNYFLVNKTSQSWTGLNYCGFNASGYFWIQEEHKLATSSGGFNEWLTTHNLEVYYALATPELIDLGQLTELPKTSNGVNNIWAETNLGNTEIEIEYVQDVKKLLEQTQAIILNNASEEVTEE